MNSMQGCFLCLLCKLLATPFGSAKRFGLQNWICCETAMTGRTFPIQNRSGIYNQLVERLHIYSTYTWICLRTQKKTYRLMDFPLEKEKNIFSKSRQNTWQNQNYSLAQLMTKRSLKIPIKPNSEEKHPMKPPRWRVAKKIRKNRWKLYSMTMFSFRGCMSSQKKTQDWSNIKQKKMFFKKSLQKSSGGLYGGDKPPWP